MSEATLSQIWHTSVKTCRLVETRCKILRVVETRRHILGQARITTKNTGPEHFGSNFEQTPSKLGQILSNWHVIFPGCVFFPGKKKGKWPVSEAHGVVRVRLLPSPSCLPDDQNQRLWSVQNGLPKWLTGWHLDLPETWFCD